MKKKLRKFKMRTAINGLVLMSEDGEILFTESAVSGSEEEIKLFANFLRDIDYHYGPTTNKYSPLRIYVKTEPGNDYEDPIGSPVDKFMDDLSELEGQEKQTIVDTEFDPSSNASGAV